MEKNGSEGSVRPTSAPLSGDQHDGATVSEDAREKTEAREEGSDVPEEPEDHQYLSGMRLFMVLAGLTLAVFLMLLDASIVATVGLELSTFRRIAHS